MRDRTITCEAGLSPPANNAGSESAQAGVMALRRLAALLGRYEARLAANRTAGTPSEKQAVAGTPVAATAEDENEFVQR
jgi:hypothetical protein